MSVKTYKSFVILASIINLFAIVSYLSIFTGLYDTLLSLRMSKVIYYIINPFILFPVNFILTFFILFIFKSDKGVFFKISIINLVIPTLFVLFILVHLFFFPET